MTSLLVITSVESLQKKLISTLKSSQNIPNIYVSLNKTQQSTEKFLKDGDINVDKFFFIDCVGSEKTSDNVVHMAPDKLDFLSLAINTFIKAVKGEKVLIIDEIATLLIYNDENKVAKFVKEITDYASRNEVKVIAFSPKTEGKELLNKVFNFFDKVERNE